MTAAATGAAAPRRTNAGAYMKSTLYSMVSITLAMYVGKWLTGQEEYVPCSTHVNDNSWLGNSRYQSLRMFDPQLTRHETQYVPVRDKTELAVDTYVSEYVLNHEIKVPTVISYTRHGRGYQVDFPFNIFTQYDKKFVNPRSNVYISRFITAGYAWVSIDVRGTGVSGGIKKHDFSDQEIEDGYDIIEWIIQQPWSDGKVTAVGHGFEGGGALLLAASGHPALKAISLNGAPIDAFNDAFFPGGVKNTKAISDFSSFTYATDRQVRWDDIPDFKARLMMKHFGGNVYRVNDDEAKFQQYIQKHLHNPVLATELENIHFRDDKLPNVGVTVQELDMIRHLGKIASSGVAIHAFGGYYDMGVAQSSILLFQYLTNQLDPAIQKFFPPLPSSSVETTRHRLSLGPWSHAGVDNSDPFAQSKQKCFWHLDEITRFFDYHVFENRQEMTQMEQEEPIHYFTLVHNRWKQTSTWPPSHVDGTPLVFYLGSNHSMSETNDGLNNGQVTLDVKFNPQYDVTSRWDMIAHLFGQRPFYYHDRAPMEDQYVTFLTPELSLMEITGQVQVRTWISLDQPAVNLVAYLEDVDYTPPFANENKRRGVTYITEALINPIHTPLRGSDSSATVYSFLKKDARELVPGQIYEVVFLFQPISYVVKAGHQLRVSIGVASPKEFGRGKKDATKVTVHFGEEYPSSLTIPMYLGVYTANIVPKEEEDEVPIASQPSKPVVVEEDEFAENKDEL